MSFKNEEKEACKNCRFFDELSKLAPASQGPVQGKCRRYPPSASMVMHQGNVAFGHEWSHVGKNDWCGEFERKNAIIS